MLTLSEFTITFKPSKDYLRGALVLHVLAIIVVLRSALPFLWMSIFIIIIICFFLNILRCKVPMPSCYQLSHHCGYWFLYESNGSVKKYEQMSFGFDGGIFLVLKLTGIQFKKNLVIFYDQMRPEQYRELKFFYYSSVENNKNLIK